MLSPEMADKSDNAMECSFSKIPSFMAYNNWVICDFTVFMYFWILCKNKGFFCQIEA